MGRWIEKGLALESEVVRELRLKLVTELHFRVAQVEPILG